MRIANCKDLQREIVMSSFNKFSQQILSTGNCNKCTYKYTGTNTRMDVMHIHMLTTGL